jgi:hypothetical protein
MIIQDASQSGLRVGPRLPSTARDSFVINPNIYALKFCSIYKIQWYPDSFIARDRIVGLWADAPGT